MRFWYSNLARSPERREHMEEVFGSILTRVEAMDGWSYSTGFFDKEGRPYWEESSKEQSLITGLVHPHAFVKCLYPSELGCAISHVQMWKAFLDSGEDTGVFFEDDVELIEGTDSRELGPIIEKSMGLHTADVLYLIGQNYAWRPLALFPDGRLKRTRNLSAYAVTRKAAETLIEHVFPLYFQIDYHLAYRFFESMQRPAILKKFPADIPAVPLLRAYGILEGAPIKMSRFAQRTTFTSTGEKAWIPEDLRIA